MTNNAGEKTRSWRDTLNYIEPKVQTLPSGLVFELPNGKRTETSVNVHNKVGKTLTVELAFGSDKGQLMLGVKKSEMNFIAKDAGNGQWLIERNNDPIILLKANKLNINNSISVIIGTPNPDYSISTPLQPFIPERQQISDPMYKAAVAVKNSMLGLVSPITGLYNSAREKMPKQQAKNIPTTKPTLQT